MSSRRRPVRSRIGALAAAVAACLGLLACTSGSGSPDAQRPPIPRRIDTRPNIVFVLTDDLTTNLVPFLPHVRAMQQEGVTLSHYFVVDSYCCPSRSAIFTGQYPHDDGVWTNNSPDGGYKAFNRNGDATKTFAVALHHAGYRTGFMGKYLNGYAPQDPVPPGWDVWDGVGNGYPEYNYQLNENGTVHSYGHRPQDYLTDVLANKATQFIDGSALSRRPFALEVATFAPHRPSTPAPRDVDSFPRLNAPRSPAFDRTPTAAPRWLANFPRLGTADLAQIDEWYRQRVESAQAVDEMIGRIQRELVATGQARNTYFVFSSDNGYHMGEYRLRPGKQTAFDTDIRVPLVVTGPGVPAGMQVDAMTSSIDLAPTFEQIAGVAPTSSPDGVSILSLWHGRRPPADWQRGVLIEHHGPDFVTGDPDIQPVDAGDPPSYEAVRTTDALYVEYADDDREYYDLANDPFELHNLAATAPPGTLAPLQRMLHALEQCQGAASCQSAARAGSSAGTVGPVTSLPR